MDEKNKRAEVDYIVSQREKGVDDEAIRMALLESGWSEDDVDTGFKEADGEGGKESTTQAHNYQESTLEQNEDSSSEEEGSVQNPYIFMKDGDDEVKEPPNCPRKRLLPKRHTPETLLCGGERGPYERHRDIKIYVIL